LANLNHTAKDEERERCVEDQIHEKIEYVKHTLSIGNPKKKLRKKVTIWDGSKW
jgi:hypothetical protein